MEIKINETVYQIKYGFRSLLIYENIVGRSYQQDGLNSLFTLFYSCLMAANPEATIDFNTFIDAMDEQPEKLEEFSNYIVNILTKNNKLSEKDVTDNKKKVTKKKKS